MSTPLLTVSDLKKYFSVKGGIFLKTQKYCKALDGVSFEIYQNETLGIVGESGCGKSTLAKTIARLHNPTSGSIFFQGQDIQNYKGSQRKIYRRGLQMIFQDPAESLNPRHTIQHILEEPFIIHKIADRKSRKHKVQQLLECVGLASDSLEKYPYEFSGGQRQRISVARSIALNPQVIICDEPVSALDVSIQSQVLNLLLDLQKEKSLSYLFIAHDIAVVRHVADRIATMYLGKIVEIGDADETYNTPKHPYTQALISSIPVPDPAKRKEFKMLKGEPASPIDIPSGCPFRTRCPHVQDICKEKYPTLRQAKGVAQGHQVACHFDL